MKMYAGAPAAARSYVESDRGRADDYCLAEGTGVARRFSVSDGQVTELEPLTGQAYETWVAGRDPDTGEPRGVLRQDARAVRFVEVVVNGPKTWSMAAALHPDIAAAYEAAQDRAAQQILGWLSAHATTRVGPRGGQVPVPIRALEAVTVRHHTSRANDPHWHLHLQINSRVFAAGKWRGLWTVDVRDSLTAINGIGHAAMATDPQFRAALAAHGYTTDTTGEIRQLAGYVGPFSARHAQIMRNADRYEREWTAAHPGELAGPELRRAWDARAWAEGRPDKVTPSAGADIGERWRAELADLGFRTPARPVALPAVPVGALDRDQLVGRALARLAAARSAWNAADVRGEVERLIAAAGVVVDAGVRLELAEDLTARVLERCVPLVQRDGVPEHIRAWTSRPVLAVEAELTARLAARAAEPRPAGREVDPTPVLGAGRLDREQVAAAAALAGERSLLVVEGAAGAGKTTTFAAARTLLEGQGRRLVVVAPTLKAAQAARAEIGAAAGSAARLVFEYGWRWDGDGAWTRLTVGALDPVSGRRYTGPGEAARLRPGDLLVVDEAGMLDQDTARAVFTLADECSARLALVGDRHQLAAVGRGGVLDLAVAQVDADAHLTLGGVHRFTRLDRGGRTVLDVDYADLTLAMRAGTDPGPVFDALAARGQIRLHPDPEALREALAQLAAASSNDGDQIAVVADTGEQVAELNAAIRGRLIAAGRVDDVHAVVTAAGEWLGLGDRVVTRRNDPTLGVANRDTWIVAAVGRDGALLVTPDVSPSVTPAESGPRWLPADYITAHVQLGYASTVHGAQGETVSAAHVVVGEHTGAAAAYVGMTRGRRSNTAHLVAENIGEAREQWVAVFGRDRADLGPAHAAELAAAEAGAYAPAYPPAYPQARPLEQVLAELRAAWTAEQSCRDRLHLQQLRRAAVDSEIQRHAESARRLGALEATCAHAAAEANTAGRRAQASAARVAAETDEIHAGLEARWEAERDGARHAARVILEGPGRLRLRRGAVARAYGQLTDWLDEWAPHLPALRVDIYRLTERTAGPDQPLDVGAGLQAAARRAAEQAHPEHAELAADARAAQLDHDRARYQLERAGYHHQNRFGDSTPADTARRLAAAEQDLAAAARELSAIRARITALQAEPALRAQPDRLVREMQAWRDNRDAESAAAQPAARTQWQVRSPRPEELLLLQRSRDRSPGPDIGR